MGRGRLPGIRGDKLVDMFCLGLFESQQDARMRSHLPFAHLSIHHRFIKFVA
jgi:hypothetical protein